MQVMTDLYAHRDKQLWDRDTALSRLGGNAGLLLKITGMFSEQLKEALPQLIAAMASDDTTSVSQQSHKLKGGAGDVGLTKLQTLLGTIEYKAKANDTREFGFLADELNQTYQETVCSLEAVNMQQ